MYSLLLVYHMCASNYCYCFIIQLCFQIPHPNYLNIIFFKKKPHPCAFPGLTTRWVSIKQGMSIIQMIILLFLYCSLLDNAYDQLPTYPTGDQYQSVRGKHSNLTQPSIYLTTYYLHTLGKKRVVVVQPKQKMSIFDRELSQSYRT